LVPSAVDIFALGGGNGRVQIRTTDDALITEFAPYGDDYTGPVSVAVGNVNGDGIRDIVTGAAVGNPHVKVFDGASLADHTFDPEHPDASLLAEWFPYALDFNVGVNVAVGDVQGNGFGDVVTAPTAGNPDVRVFKGQDIDRHRFQPEGGSLLAQWFAYGLNFNVGANVAVGDVNHDGFADVVTGATAGNPHVKVYSGKDIATGAFSSFNGDASLLASFFPYALQFNVGAFVAVGDTAGTGFGDIITGASTGNPDVRVYAGRNIASGDFNSNHLDASRLTQFYAYELGANIGVAVAAGDFRGTGKADILTGDAHRAPLYKLFAGDAAGLEPPPLIEAQVDGFEGGLFVGA
jgi:hypothetical protein